MGRVHDFIAIAQNGPNRADGYLTARVLGRQPQKPTVQAQGLAASHKLFPQLLRQIHAQWAPTKAHLETIVIHPGERTGWGCLFKTLERLFVTEVIGFAQVFKSAFCTFEAFRALHSADDFLDFLSVLLFHLHSVYDPQTWEGVLVFYKVAVSDPARFVLGVSFEPVSDSGRLKNR